MIEASALLGVGVIPNSPGRLCVPPKVASQLVTKSSSFPCSTWTCEAEYCTPWA